MNFVTVKYFCTSLVKLYYTKMTIYPIITVDMLRKIYMFSHVRNFVEAGRSIQQNLQYFIRSKNCVMNFAAVTYALHKCSETILC